MKKYHFTEEKIKDLKRFLALNKELGMAELNLKNEKTVRSFNWNGLQKKSTDLLESIKAYQRLARIIPDEDSKIIFSLLRKNIHSALQIASMTRSEFVRTGGDVFKGRLYLADLVYENAIWRRNSILMQYTERETTPKTRSSQGVKV